jgi:hypothetical protein
MANDHDEFRHESLEDRHSIAKYLTALAEAFANGNLTFRHDGQRISLEPAACSSSTSRPPASAARSRSRSGSTGKKRKRSATRASARW